MPKSLALFCGSFNPPGLHHRLIAEDLVNHFDEVIIVPCGPRPDKQTTNDVDPVHRAIMVDMTFRGLQKARVELFDLEQSTFTLTQDLDDRFSGEGEIWHIIGADLIRGGKVGQSIIQRVWRRGSDIWKNLNFAVLVNEGFDYDPDDLPPLHKVFSVRRPGASSSIRERAFKRESIDGMVMPEVASYVERYGLYRGILPGRSAMFSLKEPRLLIELDERNLKATRIAPSFQSLVSSDPNCILVIGGDGTMLHAIRKHWRLRLPFLGINAGHRGFLLNAAADLLEGKFSSDELILRQSPLLYVETQNSSGERKSALAFGDAWVERARNQTAWIEVKVNGQMRLPKMVSDGVLVSTAAGSTAYARSMGATPLLVETPALILVGSNVMEPPNWKSALLSLDSEVEFRALDPNKRPLNGFVDGQEQGEVESMKIRVSRIAAAELAFSPGYDMAEKIAQIQFPQ
jgi:NAD+ kinase